MASALKLLRQEEMRDFKKDLSFIGEQNSMQIISFTPYMGRQVCTTKLQRISGKGRKIS
jgi:hypothetical protein